MPVGLIALVYVISASFPSTAPGTSDSSLLRQDSWMTILGTLGLADLRRCCHVSTDLCRMARVLLLSKYGIQYNGKIYPNFTKMAARLEGLADHAYESSNAGDLEETYGILESSPEYIGLKALLQASFGCCISHEEEELPKFIFTGHLLGLLDDDYRISIVPHLIRSVVSRQKIRVMPYHAKCSLGHSLCRYNLICGLVERGRLDLLSQIRFQRMVPEELYVLIAARVPKAVIKVILDCSNLQRFDAGDLDLMALAGYGKLPAEVARAPEVPLLVLWSSQQSGLPLPECRLLCQGLSMTAVPFWIDLFQNESRELLELVQAKGDADIQMIMSNLKERADISRVGKEDRDVYQAILIHLYSSGMQNESVVENFQAMFGGSSFGFHSLSALLTCKQHALLAKMDGNRLSPGCELLAFIDRLHRAGSADLVSLFAKNARRRARLPPFVKSLVLQKADSSYIQVFLDVLDHHVKQIPRPYVGAAPLESCFCAPLSTLAYLASGQELSVADIEERLAEVKEGYAPWGHVPWELQVTHMLMYWGAPEAAVLHYFGQLPHDELIDSDIFAEAFLSMKYSDDLIIRCSKQCEFFEEDREALVREWRPDLARRLFPSGQAP